MNKVKPFETVLIQCSDCLYAFERYSNYWGTICPNCNQRVPPTVEHRMIKHVRLKREKLIREVIRSIFKSKGGAN